MKKIELYHQIKDVKQRVCRLEDRRVNGVIVQKQLDAHSERMGKIEDDLAVEIDHLLEAIELVSRRMDKIPGGGRNK